MSVRFAADQTFAVSDVIELVMVASNEPIELDAISVCALTAVVIPAVAVSVCELTAVVPALIAEPRELDALVTSDCRAREPLVRPAPVRVRVAADQTDVLTSVANVPKVVNERDEYDQTLSGIESIEEAIETI